MQSKQRFVQKSAIIVTQFNAISYVWLMQPNKWGFVVSIREPSMNEN